MFGAMQRLAATLSLLGEVAQRPILEQMSAATTLWWTVCILKIATAGWIIPVVVCQILAVTKLSSYFYEKITFCLGKCYA